MKRGNDQDKQEGSAVKTVETLHFEVGFGRGKKGGQQGGYIPGVALNMQ